MNLSHTTFRAFAVLLALMISTPSLLPAQSAGETRIAKWKDDKKAAYLLMFDDGWPSHFQVVLPELVKRGMIATFYLNPEKGEYKKFENTWQEDMLAAGMVIANHTMTHQGVDSLEHAEYEIGDCARYIRMMTGAPDTKLMSFGKPGVPQGKWNITNEELDEVLKKYNLVLRPKFEGRGAVYHLKTTEDMLALVDKAIAENGLDHLVIHGVERFEPAWSYQDFWPLPQAVFLPLLDGLQERRDRGELWITDHISQHQYATERETAEAKLVFAKPEGMRIELKSQAAPQFFDYPLTLITQVPAAWKSAEIKQGEKLSKVPVKDGAIQYEAVPNAGYIDIRAAE